jgi:hypothetical protein
MQVAAGTAVCKLVFIVGLIEHNVLDVTDASEYVRGQEAAAATAPEILAAESRVWTTRQEN